MEWQTTLIEFRDKGRLAEFDSGRSFTMDDILVNDRQTLETFHVKAIVSKLPAGLPDGEVLWFKNYNEDPMPNPGRIKILEYLPNTYNDYL